MNIIKVYGGIGNQLFQYAFGRAMRTDVGYYTGFYDPEQEKKNRWPRPYQLDKFNIEVKRVPLRKGLLVKEAKVKFNPKILKYQNCIFDGYWQFVDYYYGVREELKKDYHVRESLYTEEFLRWRDLIQSTPDSIGLHVRRGDYLVQKWGILPRHYYFEAIKKMPEDVPIFIFSDDIPWCKETFKEEYFSRKFHFVGMVDYLDFGAFRYCKNVIMSSSTYSWWIAFLCEGLVIAPSSWLAGMWDTKLVYPKEWIKVDIC